MRISDWSSDVCSSDLLDPLFSHIDANVRTIADAEMRKGVMNPLGDAAVAADVAILVVRHHSKDTRSEEHTSELQSLMRISYAVFCLKKKKKKKKLNRLHTKYRHTS